MSYGIDYGNGSTNIDPETGIRYGVIPANDVLQCWADESEPDYGEPTCPKCGNEAQSIDAAPDEWGDNPEWTDNGSDYCCPHCRYTFETYEAFGDEPLGFTLADEEYRASQYGDDSDIFITKSAYFTHAQFCSPCAPGACHLGNPVDSDGPRAYCFTPDWFDWHSEMGDEPTGYFDGSPTSCPYPVYRVSDGKCIFRPDGGEHQS